MFVFLVFGFWFCFCVCFCFWFSLFDILVFRCSIYIHGPVLVGGEVEDVGMLTGFGHLGNMCRTSSRTRLFAPGDGGMDGTVDREVWLVGREDLYGGMGCLRGDFGRMTVPHRNEALLSSRFDALNA